MDTAALALSAAIVGLLVGGRITQLKLQSGSRLDMLLIIGLGAMALITDITVFGAPDHSQIERHVMFAIKCALSAGVLIVLLLDTKACAPNGVRMTLLSAKRPPKQ
jgi:hypothetical protein